MGGKQPVPERLVSPSGVPLTPWTDLHARLRDSDTYLVGTIRPDSRPHPIPVLGVWMDGALYFNAKETTRKAKNLARIGTAWSRWETTRSISSWRATPRW
jgi:Pyridoxamine 5'-phosphate oxidase